MKKQTVYLFDLIGVWCGMQYYCQAFRTIFPQDKYEVKICSNYTVNAQGETIEGGQLPMIFGVNKFIGILRLLRCWWQLVKILFCHRNALVIYMAYGEFYDLPFLFTATFSRRIIADIHEVHALKYKDDSWIARLFGWLYAHLFSTVIYHSDRTHEVLTSKQIPSYKLIYIPHFAYQFPKEYVESRLSEEIKSVFSNPSTTKYLFFGNLSHPKGADIAADVFANLTSDERENVELVIAGKNVDNIDFSQLTQLSRNYHIFDRHITDDELVYLYSHTDYVLLPYRKSSQSGIMAMAIYFRRPMLCTNIPYFQTMLSRYPSFGGITDETDYCQLIRKTLQTPLSETKSSYYTQADCNSYHEHPAIERFLHRFSQLHHTLALIAILIATVLPISVTRSYAMGEWSIYNASPSTTRLQYFGDRLYGITGSSLCSFSTDSVDIDYQQLSRKSGLSGNNVQFIQVLPSANRLAIAYADGNIDLMDLEGEIHNIPDLGNKAMTGDKTLYSIDAVGNQLFVSGGFGFLIVDGSQDMITQSYTSTFAVDFAFQWQDALYRYSAKRGLEYGTINSNLSDLSSWHKLSTPKLSKVYCFTVDNQDFCWLLASDGTLLSLNTEQQLQPCFDFTVKELYQIGSRIFLTTGKGVLYVCNPITMELAPNSDQPFTYATQFTPSNTEDHFFMLVNSNTIYRANLFRFVAGEVVNFETDWENTLQPDGIGTYYLGEMQLIDGGLVGISRRSYPNGYEQANALPGVVTFFDQETEDFTNLTASTLAKGQSGSFHFQGLTGIAIDPLHAEQYAISTGLHGVYFIDHDSISKHLDHTNSQGGIQAFDPTFASTRVSSILFDENHNLYIANSMQDTTLRCLTSDQKWIKYPNAGFSQQAEVRRILISQHDDNQYKWLLNDFGYQKSRIGIYYDGGSPEKVGSPDYQTSWFNTLIDQDNNSYLPYYIYDLCEDLEGKIWVLTNLGPFVIEDQYTTFEYAKKNVGRGLVRRVKIPRNDGTNLADYLMESTYCTCMVVDNFNRKWIGTQGAGLYLMSADCITTIEHFTTDDSPLLSDDILNLCYDAASGLLYISCEGGLVSYQTDAIEGEADLSSIYCYPNPIRPEYSGELRIMGLMNDTQVSITTTNGNLVYRTTSQGATATWNLRTASGSRVDPGVYVIHGVSEDGKKGSTCKFLVL